MTVGLYVSRFFQKRAGGLDLPTRILRKNYCIIPYGCQPNGLSHTIPAEDLIKYEGNGDRCSSGLVLAVRLSSAELEKSEVCKRLPILS